VQSDALNDIVGHIETPGLPGFTGETPQDRATAAGYAKYAGETVAYLDNPWANVWQLMGAPYHAAIMLGGYQYNDVGIGQTNYISMAYGGYSPFATTFDLGGPSVSQQMAGDQLAVFPCNGVEVNISAQFGESPTPSVLNGNGSFGYSSLAVVRQGQNLAVSSWVLTDKLGLVIPTVMMNSGNDANKLIPPNAVTLIPISPLPDVATTYTSTLSGTNNGVPFSKTCIFNTVTGTTLPTLPN
jgi:hypothetical protein